MSRMNGWFEFKFSRPLKHVRTLKGGSNLSVKSGSRDLSHFYRGFAPNISEFGRGSFPEISTGRIRILIRHKSLAVTSQQDQRDH